MDIDYDTETNKMLTGLTERPCKLGIYKEIPSPYFLTRTKEPGWEKSWISRHGEVLLKKQYCDPKIWINVGKSRPKNI